MKEGMPNTTKYIMNTAKGSNGLGLIKRRSVEVVATIAVAKAILSKITLNVGSCQIFEYSRTVSFTFAFSPKA